MVIDLLSKSLCGYFGNRAAERWRSLLDLFDLGEWGGGALTVSRDEVPRGHCSNDVDAGRGKPLPTSYGCSVGMVDFAPLWG